MFQSIHDKFDEIYYEGLTKEQHDYIYKALIELDKYVSNIIKEKPVLLLDDVLSELDSNRQKLLLDSIEDIQTIITCTGLDDFVNNRFDVNKIFKVVNGNISEIKDM